MNTQVASGRWQVVGGVASSFLSRRLLNPKAAQGRRTPNPGGSRVTAKPLFRALLGFAVGLACSVASSGVRAADPGPVRIWEEPLMLTSYSLDAPDPNPMFYRGESYQGAQKRVYPYALQDGITGERTHQEFQAVYLENEHIKLCVLPQIGGRLFYATDKSNGYDFFYRQSVMKPALIGMLGAWISGGIEWCVFHHHRNTTHLPVDYALRENEDGSKTIWIGEIERRHRMRWMIGITLHPGKAFIEVEVRMINRTAMPHSILYWANVAVHANDDYQVIFPPSVQVATYHAKNDFVHWPIGHGRYQGSDYTDVDLSWWKNHPRSVSCFAWDLQEDFMGGYDHGREAGVVHVGNHHIVCGAKLWEWAPGSIWDTRILTDSDGPYAEIMVGAFSDNQPDYSWIKPYEVKQFRQYWYPVREIGGFKNANLDAALNLEIRNRTARIGVQVTSSQPDSHLVLSRGSEVLLDHPADLVPGRPLVTEVPLGEATGSTELKATLLDARGKVLVGYQPTALPPVSELPPPVRPPPAPETIGNLEELYFAGLRAEQIYQPRVDPTDYYSEALRRDPNDVRCNTLMGIHYNRRGLYSEAEEHLRRAIRRLTTDYTRSKDTEAFYQLGLSLKAQGRIDEATDVMYRASWDAAFHGAAYYQLATLSCRRGDFQSALEQANEALSSNTKNVRAWNLKTAAHRRLGELEEASRVAMQVCATDPLDRWARNELRLLREPGLTVEDPQLFAKAPENQDVDAAQPRLELASDYLDAGLHEEAVELLQFTETELTTGRPSPVTLYYCAYLDAKTGNLRRSDRWLDAAVSAPAEHCFPFRLETVDVLEDALRRRPKDARAHYVLGTLLYELQPDRAVTHWEKARELEPSLAIAHRNLGWAYQRHLNDPAKAIASYEQAIEHNSNDPRYYLELDDLYERANTSPKARLAMLERNPDVTVSRKDLLIRQIRLLVVTRDYRRAIDLLENNRFFISEGGGRELGEAYVDAHLLRGLELLREGEALEARRRFQAAATYPENLSQESPRNERRMPQVNYLLAGAERALENETAAGDLLRQVAETRGDRSRETAFYRAKALAELGQDDRARSTAEGLVSWATAQLGSEAESDVFAKFGEQETLRTQQADVHYVMGLGLLALGRDEEAIEQFEQALVNNPAHVWAAYYAGATKAP